MKPIHLPEAFRELFQPARYKAYYGGRGSGKSHSFASSLLIHGGQRPLRIMCAREVQNSIKDSVKLLLDDKIAEMDVTDFYKSTESEIRGANGTRFLFAGLGKLTADQIKSMEGIDICWVEEAQTISKPSLEILLPTIRKEGSEIWFSWNPRNASDPVDLRFRGENPPPDSIIRMVNWDENPYFPDVLRQEMEHDRITNPDRFAHIWLGEYEPMAIGAIWNRAVLAESRRPQRHPDECDDLSRVLVAVDHAISSEAGSNEHGIIVGGMDEEQHAHVLEDATTEGPPAKWATRAIAMYDKWEADAVVIERNQGGDLVRNTLEAHRPGLPIVEVVATRGKHVRAEPVAAQYALGRVHHCGTFQSLEDQMCMMTNAGWEGPANQSPDRTDALVWLLSELFPHMTKRTRKRNRVRPEAPVVGGWMGA